MSIPKRLKPFINALKQSKVVHLIVGTFMKWQSDRCLEMGAALSYYALFSFFPLFIVALSIASSFLGPETNAFNDALRFVEQAFPPEAAKVVQQTMEDLNESSIGAGIVGFSLLVFTASGIFGALTSSLDVIWKATPADSNNANWKSGMWTLIRRRIFGLSLVFVTAALLLISLFANIAINVFLEMLQSFGDRLFFIRLDIIDEVLLINTLQNITLLIMLFIVVMVLFKLLPATAIAWGDVWLGAMITILLFFGLQQLIGNSVIQIGSRFRSYGVIGGVMVLMFWLYLTCQIFFLGSTFTYVYALLFGSRRIPPRRETFEEVESLI
ncbi:MAG: YihY/virulence factor BrkB family protein [Elainellaceae cyanobacterium]